MLELGLKLFITNSLRFLQKLLQRLTNTYAPTTAIECKNGVRCITFSFTEYCDDFSTNLQKNDS